MLKDLCNNHPIKFSLSTSLLASIVYSLVFETIINKVKALGFLKINWTFPFPKEKPLSFDINIISIVFALAVIVFISVFIAKAITRDKLTKQIKTNLPNDDFCTSCKTIIELTDKYNNKKQQYENLIKDYQQALPYKKLTDALKKYFSKNEILESIQLFSAPELPSLEEVNMLKEINIPIHYVYGIAKEFSNTNALLNINYSLDKATYYEIKKLFDMRNKYFGRKAAPRNPQIEKDIQKDAITIFENLKERLSNISDKKDIKDVHYVYYKLLDILANIVIGKKIKYKNLLGTGEIENQLKYGQRTGLLGAIFTGQLYCFYNDNSITKKDRIYFSVPMSYKEHQFILLGICSKSNLRVAKDCDCIDCCAQIYDEISKALIQIGGDAS